MDLTFQVHLQYCSLQHQTLPPLPVTSMTRCCFCFGSVSSFFLKLFLHWSPVAYWAPTDLGSSSFQCPIILPNHTVHGVLKARRLLIVKFRLKLKKVGKTTRPFMYDLNQIPYNYTVKGTNRFKGFDLIECLKNYGRRFVTLYRRQWSRPSPRKRNAKRQNGCLRSPYK